MKKLFIRVDANEQVALGHLKRCWALSCSLIKIGIHPVFLSSFSNATKDILNEREVLWMEKSIGDFDDAQVIVDLAKKSGVDVLLIDSYKINQDYIKILIDSEIKVIIFDDEGVNFNGVFAVINGGPVADFKYSTLHQLLGLNYLILAPCYLKSVPKVIKTKVENIMITVGGIDHYNLSSWLIREIDAIYLEADFKPVLHVVIGPYFQNTELIIEAKNKSALNIKLHYSPANLFDLISIVDIAVTGGGGTIYELIKMGVPSLAIGLSEQQNLNLSLLIKCEVLEVVMGKQNKIFEDNHLEIGMKLRKIILDVDLRRRLSMKSLNLIDGKGAERVSGFLDSLVGSIDE